MSLNTTPRTWVAGETVTAAEMNAEIRDVATGIQAAWSADARTAATIWTGSGTNPVIGNGTIDARINRVGKSIEWSVMITMGSTTTFGTGTWQLVLPVTPRAAFTGNWGGRAYDVSASPALGFPVNADMTTTALIQLRTSATVAGSTDRGVTSAIPMTWATGDILYVQGRYEAA